MINSISGEINYSLSTTNHLPTSCLWESTSNPRNYLPNSTSKGKLFPCYLMPLEKYLLLANGFSHCLGRREDQGNWRVYFPRVYSPVLRWQLSPADKWRGRIFVSLPWYLRAQNFICHWFVYVAALGCELWWLRSSYTVHSSTSATGGMTPELKQQKAEARKLLNHYGTICQGLWVTSLT